MATPIEKLKAMWQKDIENITEEKRKLADENSQKAVEGFELRIKTLEDELVKKNADIENINKIISERKLPEETQEKSSKGGFNSLGDFFGAIGKTRIDHNDDKRLFENNERMLTKAPSASNSQSAIVGSEGGFLIPEYFANQLLEDMNNYGRLLSRCFQLPVNGPLAIIPALCDYDHSSKTYYGGVSVTRSKERAQITGTSADFGQIEMRMKKLVGMVGLTSELRRWSSISVEPILRRMLATAMSATIEDELINGRGAGAMEGLLESPAKVTISAEDGQTANDLRAENITHMIEILPDPATAPTFIHHLKLFTDLVLLKLPVALGGAPLNWYNITAKTLLTYAAEKSEFCPTVNTEGDLILADLGAYVYAYEAGGEQVVSSPHFWFDYDTDAIRFTMYNDGHCWWKTSKLLADGSTYVSPILTLATRS